MILCLVLHFCHKIVMMMQRKRTPCLVRLGIDDEEELVKGSLGSAANFSFVTALDEGRLRLFSEVEHGHRQRKKDVHGTHLDNGVRPLLSLKPDFARMSRIQLSVSYVGPRCGGWEEQRRGQDLLPRRETPVLRKVIAHGCCSRKWARYENSEELRLRLSSSALLVVVVAQWVPCAPKSLLRDERTKGSLTLKTEMNCSSPLR